MKNVKVIGRNGKPLGTARVVVRIWRGRPSTVRHAGCTYRATGGEGISPWTGELVFQMSTWTDHPGTDQRIWANPSASTISEG